MVIDITKGIERDKLAHFFASYFVLTFLSLILSDLWTILIVLSIAIYKDVINDLYLGKGKFEWLDLLFSCLPIGMFLINKYI